MAEASTPQVDDNIVCQLCGTLENLSLCAGCRDTWYCCKEHQRADWKKHKGTCKKVKTKTAHKVDENNSSIPLNSTDKPYSTASVVSKCSSSQSKSNINQTTTSKNNQEGKNAKTTTTSINRNLNAVSLIDSTTSENNQEAKNVKTTTTSINRNLSAVSLIDSMKPDSDVDGNEQDTTDENSNNSKTYFTVLKTRFDVLAEYVVDCLKKYGLCVIDNFLNESKGTEILEEVHNLRKSGVFTEGQLVNSSSGTSQNIRGDILTWVEGTEKECENINFLISCMDAIILRCSGKLGKYVISERTKAMVACYPGSKTGYIKHVDNPNGDGRCITCIYYLNKNWDVRKQGGMLRIYPEGQDLVANIKPTFDRVLYFWSDRRNPHEVQATTCERYAITVWYYDKEERYNALKGDNGQNSAKQSAIPLTSST